MSQQTTSLSMPDPSPERVTPEPAPTASGVPAPASPASRHPTARIAGLLRCRPSYPDFRSHDEEIFVELHKGCHG